MIQGFPEKGECVFPMRVNDLTHILCISNHDNICTLLEASLCSLFCSGGCRRYNHPYYPQAPKNTRLVNKHSSVRDGIKSARIYRLGRRVFDV